MVVKLNCKTDFGNRNPFVDLTSARERGEAVRARIAAINREEASAIERLRGELAATHARGAERRAAAEVAAREADHAIASALVVDARAALEPLLKRWHNEPTRAVAAEIDRVLGDLLKRESVEAPTSTTPRPISVIGSLLSSEAVNTYPGAVAVFAADERPDSYWNGVANIGKALGSAVGMHTALGTLESTIEAMARGAAGRPFSEHASARFAVKLALDARALAEFDEARSEAQRAEMIRNWTVPPGTRIRTGRIDADADGGGYGDDTMSEAEAALLQ